MMGGGEICECSKYAEDAEEGPAGMYECAEAGDCRGIGMGTVDDRCRGDGSMRMGGGMPAALYGSNSGDG